MLVGFHDNSPLKNENKGFQKGNWAYSQKNHYVLVSDFCDRHYILFQILKCLVMSYNPSVYHMLIILVVGSQESQIQMAVRIGWRCMLYGGLCGTMLSVMYKRRSIFVRVH